ncbi:NUMOD4 domain-containing protein [Methanosarcina sp. WH1]|uniref:NUMOD4 domain-containing protein n=1 Tax=Methanosarcina sp. WH1 TaxID=1434102 RepID=UPI0012E0145A|nr:NUMOD4 domain-containing protein [Methanosarcina sp. WH1]
MCGLEKEEKEFSRSKYVVCKACFPELKKKQRRDYQRVNRERFKPYKKEYEKKNKEKINAQQRERRKKRKERLQRGEGIIKPEKPKEIINPVNPVNPVKPVKPKKEKPVKPKARNIRALPKKLEDKMKTEEWKVITGFEDYEISSIGQIRSKTHNSRMIQPYRAPYGIMVSLRAANGAHRTIGLKALMKQAFGTSLPEVPQVKQEVPQIKQEVPQVKQEVPQIREKPKEMPAPKLILDESSCEAWL